MGIFDTNFGTMPTVNPVPAAPTLGTAPQLTPAGGGVGTPAISPALNLPTAIPNAGAGTVIGMNPMSIASILGMMASAVKPDSGGGRVGAGVHNMANSQLMAQALLEREKGQRDFLKALLSEHGKVKDGTDNALMGMTPSQVNGGQ